LISLIEIRLPGHRTGERTFFQIFPKDQPNSSRSPDKLVSKLLRMPYRCLWRIRPTPHNECVWVTCVRAQWSMWPLATVTRGEEIKGRSENCTGGVNAAQWWLSTVKHIQSPLQVVVQPRKYQSQEYIKEDDPKQRRNRPGADTQKCQDRSKLLTFYFCILKCFCQAI
jgi:hypothetical protein